MMLKSTFSSGSCITRGQASLHLLLALALEDSMLHAFYTRKCVPFKIRHSTNLSTEHCLHQLRPFKRNSENVSELRHPIKSQAQSKKQIDFLSFIPYWLSKRQRKCIFNGTSSAYTFSIVFHGWNSPALWALDTQNTGFVKLKAFSYRTYHIGIIKNLKLKSFG